MKTTSGAVLSNLNPFSALKNIKRIKITAVFAFVSTLLNNYSFAVSKMFSHVKLFQSVYIHFRREIKSLRILRQIKRVPINASILSTGSMCIKRGEKNTKTLNQMLKEIGYNDSPLRRELINTIKEWLQQKQDYRKHTGYEKSIDSQKRYRKNQIIKEFLEELEKEK